MFDKASLDTTWLILSHEIDQIIVESREVFENSITRGKRIVQGLEAQKLALFNDLWDKLAIDIPFTSIEEVDCYYQNIGLSFKPYIEEFCGKAGLQFEKMNPGTESLFIYVININHMFAKIKFLLNQFREGDIQTILSINLEDVAIDCEFNLKSESDLLTETNLLLSHLMEYENDVMSAFKKLNYINQTNQITDEVKPTNQPSEVKALLQTFPSISVLNHAIDEFQLAYQQKKEIEEKKQALVNLIKLIQNNQNQLNIIFSDKLNYLNLLSYRMKASRTRLAQYKEELNHHMRLLKLFELFQQLQLINLCGTVQAPSAVAKITLGFWQENWVAAKVALFPLFNQFQNELDKFIAQYFQYMLPIAALPNIAKNVSSLKQTQETVYQKLEESEKHFIAEWNRMNAVLMELETNLIKHLPPDTKDSLTLQSKTFLRQHWWRLSLGGIGIGGPSAATAVLFSLNPLAMAVVIGGSTGLGVIAGAGFGAIIDYQKPKSTTQMTLWSNSSSNSENALLNREPTPRTFSKF